MLVTRKPSAFADFDHIYSKDPAIDIEHEDYDHEKWLESGFEKFLPLKPGQEPTVFRLRHLRGREYSELVDLAQSSGMTTAATEAFKRCVVKISDHDFDRVAGRVPDEVVDMYYFAEGFDPGAVVLEVGLRPINEATPKKKSLKG